MKRRTIITWSSVKSESTAKRNGGKVPHVKHEIVDKEIEMPFYMKEYIRKYKTISDEEKLKRELQSGRGKETWISLIEPPKRKSKTKSKSKTRANLPLIPILGCEELGRRWLEKALKR